MHRVSASASRSLPSQDLRRYSYKLSYPADNNGKAPPSVCRCTLPERPDEWSEKMWRKYLAAMARLPCKLCKTEPVVYAPPTRSSLPAQGSTTSIMRLLSKGKKHYKERKKDSKPQDGDEAGARGMEKGEEKEEEEEQQHQDQQDQREKQLIHGEGEAPPAEGLCTTPFCATNTPSSVADATSAAAVFPRRKKGAAPWDEG